MTSKIILKNKYQTVKSVEMSDYQQVHIDSNDGVVVALTISGGYYIVNHLRNNEKSLEFVRGYIEQNESPEEAGLREVSEELNILKLDVHSVKVCGWATPDNGLLSQKVYFVLIQLQFKPNLIVDTNEDVLNVKWVDNYEISELVKNNKISDMFTLAFLAKLQKSI